MAVEITSREEFKAWLEDKPLDWKQALAPRSALRVLPLSIETELWNPAYLSSRIVEIIFRAAVLSVAIPHAPASRFTEPVTDADRAIDHTLRDERTAGHVHQDASTSTSALADAMHAYNPSWATNGALNAAVYGAEAVGYASPDVWRQVSWDCNQLAQGFAPRRLAQKPLWDDRPKWFQDAWGRVARRLSQPEPGFEVWREWYYGRLEGLPHAFASFDDEADRKFYEQIIEYDDDWWSRDPAEVNADIKAFVDSLRKSKATGERPNLTDAEVREALEKSADPQMRIENGQFIVSASLSFGPERSIASKSVAQSLIDLATMLSDGLEDNAPNALRAALKTYAAALSRSIKAPPPDTLDPASGVVRKLYLNEGHESWAKGLKESFERFLALHARLLGKMPETNEQKQIRATIPLNEKKAETSALSNDVERFREIVERLKEEGVTDESARAYLDALVDLGMEIAFGGPALQESDEESETAPANWAPTDSYRANITGLAIQMETQIATALAVTAHPQFQSVLPAISDFVAHMLRYFG